MMTLKLVRFASLCCTALVMGLAFAHVLELPGKLRLDGADWLTVQHNLYIAFGVPVGAALELGAIIFTWIAAAMLRGHRTAFRLTLWAAIVSTIGLVAWALIVSPMNAVLNGWTPATLPAGWTAVRDRWEAGHALHFVLFGAAFVLLVMSMLTDRSERTR